MNEPTSALSAWESFYVIVGSSGAALIGIQFVVMTLIADRRPKPTAETLNAFGTPTIVHLAGALVVSAIMSAPWRSLVGASLALVVCGVGGMVYSVVVIRRARRQTGYVPVWQDWVWYVVLPCGIYGVLTFAAGVLRTYSHPALFLIATTAMGLLLTGIHNAWDTVTHIVVPEAQD